MEREPLRVFITIATVISDPPNGLVSPSPVAGSASQYPVCDLEPSSMHTAGASTSSNLSSTIETSPDAQDMISWVEHEPPPPPPPSPTVGAAIMTPVKTQMLFTTQTSTVPITTIEPNFSKDQWMNTITESPSPVASSAFLVNIPERHDEAL
ncbi:hypothetical protein NM688_g5913 [Phlebia brevispora]|uniref:Uncharacterized protein n=1 Tax=Phlebia brevispora TaxID=194682 RepID=A0ACC1SMY8_9APHY|nr:hypothetical protein NM688_g5913 [Phlebia brevispora]